MLGREMKLLADTRHNFLVARAPSVFTSSARKKGRFEKPLKRAKTLVDVAFRLPSVSWNTVVHFQICFY